MSRASLVVLTIRGRLNSDPHLSSQTTKEGQIFILELSKESVWQSLFWVQIFSFFSLSLSLLFLLMSIFEWSMMDSLKEYCSS